MMISYYDIRCAINDMCALHNYLILHTKLDIHLSFTNDYPPEKNINLGTLVAFNLDPSVINEDLRLIFWVYGDLKEIRDIPHK